MQKYIFKMSDAEKEFLQPMKTIWPDYKITSYELQNPTVEFVLNFFERFINETQSVNIQHVVDHFLSMVPNEECEIYSYPVHILVVHKCLTQNFTSRYSKNIQMFALNLLLRPKVKATQFQFTYLKNYLMFKNNCFRILDEIHMKKHSFIEQKKHLEMELNLLKNHENEMAIKRSIRNTKKKEFENQIKMQLDACAEIKEEEKELIAHSEYFSTIVTMFDKSRREKFTYLEELKKKKDHILEGQRLTAEKLHLQKILKETQEKSETVTSNSKLMAINSTLSEKIIEHNVFKGIVEDFTKIFTIVKNYQNEQKENEKELNGFQQKYNVQSQNLKNEQSITKSRENELNNLEKHLKNDLNLLLEKNSVLEKETILVKQKYETKSEENVIINDEIRKCKFQQEELENKIKSLEQLWLKKYQLLLESSKCLHLNFLRDLKDVRNFRKQM